MFLGSGSAQPKLCIFVKNDNRMKKVQSVNFSMVGKRELISFCDAPDQNAGKTLNFGDIGCNFRENVIFLLGKRGVLFLTIGSTTDNRI